VQDSSGGAVPDDMRTAPHLEGRSDNSRIFSLGGCTGRMSSATPKISNDLRAFVRSRSTDTTGSNAACGVPRPATSSPTTTCADPHSRSTGTGTGSPDPPSLVLGDRIVGEPVTPTPQEVGLGAHPATPGVQDHGQVPITPPALDRGHIPVNPSRRLSVGQHLHPPTIHTSGRTPGRPRGLRHPPRSPPHPGTGTVDTGNAG
jgi:hypothetical protein